MRRLRGASPAKQHSEAAQDCVARCASSQHAACVSGARVAQARWGYSVLALTPLELYAVGVPVAQGLAVGEV